MDSIALHIPVCFDSNKPEITDSRRVLELVNLKTLVREIKVPIYVSINGECNKIWIDRVYNAVAWPGTFVKEVFHRENIGYQWGGFYDMFKKLTEVDNGWTHFATLEVDCFLQPDWLEKCLDAGQQHVGMPPYRDHISPLQFPKRWEKKFLTSKGHTRGGFHFCKKNLLEKIDKRFGCFTHAEGSDLTIDGICHGEIGFCQKIVAVGSGLHPIDDICFITELRPGSLMKKHKLLESRDRKKKAENTEMITIPSDTTMNILDTDCPTGNMFEKEKKRKLKRQQKEAQNQEKGIKTLSKKREERQKPKVKKKDGKTLNPEEIEKLRQEALTKPEPKKAKKVSKKKVIIPPKISRYRAQRNRLNANNERKGRFRLGP